MLAREGFSKSRDERHPYARSTLRGGGAPAWIDAYELTGDERCLAVATTIFDYLTTDWDDICEQPTATDPSSIGFSPGRSSLPALGTRYAPHSQIRWNKIRAENLIAPSPGLPWYPASCNQHLTRIVGSALRFLARGCLPVAPAAHRDTYRFQSMNASIPPRGK